MSLNKSLYKGISFLIILLFFQSSVIGQIRIAVYGMQINKSKKKSLIAVKGAKETDRNKMEIVPKKIINFFSNNSDFIVIDRKNKALIENELELQKSESFMDGYIVDQGKTEGADMICTTIFDESSKNLMINIYDVTSGQVYCSREKKMKSNFIFGLTEIDKVITSMLHDISSSCFDKGFPVVRITKEKKGKAKEILVLAGYAQRLKINYKMEILKIVEEDIGGVKRKRKMKIGTAYVIRIEDDNFSILELSAGKKEIFNALANGEKLKCKLISEN